MSENEYPGYAEAVEKLRQRKRAYQLAWDDVLTDLAAFCRAAETTFHVEPRVQAMLEGRRQVFLRIVQHFELSPQELAVLYRASILKSAGVDND